MQLGLPFQRAPSARRDVLAIGGHPVPVAFVRARRARHYILRVRPDGSLRVTVPWHGSRAEALRFVQERRDWVARERYQRAVEASARRPWADGTPVLFRGHEYPLRVSAADSRRVRVSFGDQSFTTTADRAADLRRSVEKWMRRVAEIDLPERIAVLARQHGFVVEALTIRSQRSRWGSCSSSGRISLNWRLIQFPSRIVDYVILHELVHLHHLNHSRRFWDELTTLCPDYKSARQWLRQFGHRGGADDRA